jgi:hypothetical protein
MSAVVVVVTAVAFIAVRDGGEPPRDEVMSATELLERLQRPVAEAQLRSILGDPTQVEVRGSGSLWTYERPLANVTRLQFRFGAHGRVVAVGLSDTGGAPSLGAQLERDYGSRCKGWARNDETVWCFDPSAIHS